MPGFSTRPYMLDKDRDSSFSVLLLSASCSAWYITAVYQIVWYANEWRVCFQKHWITHLSPKWENFKLENKMLTFLRAF